MRSPLAERTFLVQSGAVARKNIPSFIYFVIPMMLAASSIAAEGSLSPFIMIDTDVMATVDAEAIQPQLRTSGEIGLAFPVPLRPSIALGGMLIEPSIPANAILYRGYYGGYVAAAIDLHGRDGGEARPFISLGTYCALARYVQTELYFLAYSFHLAPGLTIERGRFELRLSLPLRVEFRGDATSLSAGLALAVARPSRRPAELGR
jgi:hypothetical protein